MKRKRLRILAYVMLLAGVAVLLFPAISDRVQTWRMDRQIDAYRARIANYQSTASGSSSNSTLEKLYQEMLAYNRHLFETGQADLKDPFSYEQPSFDLKRFGFDENMIGYLDVPKMDLHVPIYLGASRANMAKGAAHLTQTSLPVGGANSNAVIAGHRGMRTQRMFREIDKLALGDDVYITNFRETLHYRVAEIRIILPSDIKQVLIQPGRDLVTLLTCNPLGHNYQRYAVYCERTRT